MILTVYRGTEAFEVQVMLGIGEDADGPGAVPLPPGTVPPALAGAMIESLEPGHPTFGMVDGVAVTTVEPGSAADRSGLRPGDVITAVNRETIASKAELDARLAAATGQVALTVWRDGRDMLVVLEA